MSLSHLANVIRDLATQLHQRTHPPRLFKTQGRRFTLMGCRQTQSVSARSAVSRYVYRLGTKHIAVLRPRIGYAMQETRPVLRALLVPPPPPPPPPPSPHSPLPLGTRTTARSRCHHNPRATTTAPKTSQPTQQQQQQQQQQHRWSHYRHPPMTTTTAWDRNGDDNDRDGRGSGFGGTEGWWGVGDNAVLANIW
ncbi:hypothetical protein BD410DRAFT_826385 [Rickenella mellea]|uniref:Uncharacterized protein n=1 Tax=Rickenella mellea TaxID=50990 RepID=A0A4Y7QDU8_9AGAM|nr:hypothetical protein BD410DRAFT_826385 [Rickenella mellea]